jgi:hypothetical protein
VEKAAFLNKSGLSEIASISFKTINRLQYVKEKLIAADHQ